MSETFSSSRGMRRLAGVIGLGLLTACTTVGPDFARPAAPADATYGEDGALAEAGRTAGPEAVIGAGPEIDWWKAFGSPELDALVERAIASNRTIAASDARLARARQEVLAARGGALPQVDANARVEHEQVNLAAVGFSGDALGVPLENPEFTLYSVGGGVSYDLDLFGGRRREIEQSAAEAEAQLRRSEAAHLTLAGQVVNQVLTIAALRARIDTAEVLIEEDRRNVELTDRRRVIGVGTLVEVLNARSQLDADLAELPPLRQSLSEAQHLLAVLVGEMPADVGIPAIDIADLQLPPQIPVTLPSELAHRRPDILQSEAEWHAATAAVGVATARLYPDITLGATLDQGAPGLGDLLSSSFRGFDIFAGLTAPLFHGGTLHAEKQAAIDNARAVQADYEQTLLEAFGQVADLLAALRHDAEAVEAQQASVATAERSRHLSRRSFEVGNSDVLEVLDAQRVYQRARAGLIDAQARQYVDVARLFVATAGGWTGEPVLEASAQASPAE